VRHVAARLQAFRQLGARRGTAAASRHLRRTLRGRIRRAWLTRHPIALPPGALTAALGGRDLGSAFRIAGMALPSVSRAVAWADQADAAARAEIIGVADQILAHEFDLLGSGPVSLGPSIDWHRDFKSGRRWPLDHFTKIIVSYPDDSDIKVPWELSRAQHLPVLALAHRISGNPRYLDELGAQLTDWLDANPVEFGVNWQCTMDVAIRATNWVAALVICAMDSALPAWAEPAATGLLLHARFIRANLEYGPARGNHYLSDVVGLLVTAGVFQSSSEGRRWIKWSIDQLGLELRHQIRSDGCDHEASTSYHRLVTELFIVGADAADVLASGTLDPEVRPTLQRMLQFVVDYTRPDGLAPQIGDADNGRLLPLEDYGIADQRSHLHLFRQAGVDYRPAEGSAGYPAGGFFFLRSGELYAALRCGDVGIHGRGCHAHNDLLGFELCWRDRPLVVDPGSFVYTADPAQRNAFRSTTRHSTLQIDGREQNEIPVDRLFAMPDRAHAEVLSFTAEATPVFRGRHHGFGTSAERCVHTRTVRLDGAGGLLQVTDEVRSDARHQLTWRFPLAPCEVESGDGYAKAHFPGVTLLITGNELTVGVEAGQLSPAYGERTAAPVVIIRGRSEPGMHRTLITLATIADSSDRGTGASQPGPVIPCG
jgi:Heparinase II/III-like protein/Heparinase II/III N-terminus